MIIGFFAVFCSCLLVPAHCGLNDRVLLRDVQVITVKAGQYTAGRRSAPVPQLKCVGGSAQGQYNPQLVQCYNRGSDGADVQWECKADMDNDFRFGAIEVICEGFDYPDDPFILGGSCGLEYTLELTKQGHAKKTEKHDYGYSQGGNYGTQHNTKASTSELANLIPLLIVGIIIYAVYRTCINPQRDETGGGAPYPDDGFGPNQRRPPPPGFRPGYDGYDNGPGSGGGCGGTGTMGGGSYTNYRNRNDGPGFWTGMGAGGLMGYLFGGRNRGYGGYGGYGQPGYRAGPSFWGGPSTTTHTDTWGGGGGGGSPSNTTTGTRTASGFGGTRRR